MKGKSELTAEIVAAAFAWLCARRSFFAQAAAGETWPNTAPAVNDLAKAEGALHAAMTQWEAADWAAWEKAP